VNGFFVTGTDTGVGKTLVAGALARVLRERGLPVGVAKPVQSGNLAADPEGDAMVLRRLAGVADPPEVICPCAFAAPLAPLVAARLESRTIEPGPILDAVDALGRRYGALLVEGAGGLLVPVGEDWTIADLARLLKLPLLVVARAGLGTVNHTLLTVEAARQRGLEVAGVVLNAGADPPDASAATNPELIETFGDVPVLGALPPVADESEAPAALARSLDVEPLLAVLDRQEAFRA
jgi:dethiobiotin synthetase